MAFKMLKIFVIFCIILTYFRILSAKFDQISVCESSSDTCIGCRYGKFICGDISKETEIFQHSSDAIWCKNQGYFKKYFGTIDFVNCRFPVIQRNFFEIFNGLHTFNITNMDLDSLQPSMFQSAKSLTHLIASHNHLTEIPPLLLIGTIKLTHVDFSNNSIEQVDALSFVGANNIEWIDLSYNNLTELKDQLFKGLSSLKFLNLSHNQINVLHPEILNTPNLQKFDITNNNLTELNEHTFDHVTDLKYLNLSFNPIGNVNVNTFVYLADLEHLNLRHTNLSSIQLGTFSHQHKLITLDLSENLLKELNCKLFFPIMHDLRSLRLGGNQIKEIIGFRNALFPSLELLDIINNQFNCSYLHKFMENVNWEKLHLHLVPKSVKSGETDIRGISCIDTVYEPEDENNAVKYEHKDVESVLVDGFSKFNAKSNDNMLTHILLVFILVVMSAYFIIFLILNRDQIFIKHRASRPPHVRTTSVLFNNEQNEQNETLLF